MKTLASTSIYLDTRRIKKNNTYPVKLRVTYGRKSQFYNTNLSLTKEDFESLMTTAKPRVQQKAIKADLVEIERKATKIIENMPQFNFPTFKKKFLGSEYLKGDVFSKYKEYIQTLEKNDQLGTASSYQCSKNSLKLFLEKYHNLKSESFPFAEITPLLLQEYENYMIKENESTLSTVGVYLRPLRALFNIAIEEGDISMEMYPFGKRKYQIPATSNNKRALDNEDLKKLLNATADRYEEKARDFWFLSYLCNGINMKDIAELKYETNLQSDRIVFFREKTKRSNKANLRSIVVPLNDHASKIIEKYKTSDESKGKYVFTILNDEMNSVDKRKAIINFTRFVNQHLKRLAVKAKIENKISSMWARHTFAVTMENNDANEKIIMESLGHTNLKTTQNYLSSIRMDRKKDLSDKLMDFNK